MTVIIIMTVMEIMWQDGLAARPVRRPLENDVRADAVIVGAGLTGLWTAYYLKALAPAASVVVLEAETAGFGASGRNGGWCSGELPGGPEPLARRYGREAAVAMQRAAFATVGEVRRVVEREGIDCRLRQGGSRLLALNGPQAARLEAMVRVRRELGFGAEDHRLLDAAETRRHLAVADVLASSFTPHCAALDPARLTRGLAEAVEARGVTIHEGSAVLEVRPRLARTARAAVRADTVVVATEGFTALSRRSLATVYSYMAATEPLSAEFWAETGWDDHATVADQRFHFTYLQRTADGRIALGGRGIGVPWGRPHPALDRAPAVHRRLASALRRLFPALAGAAVTHRWGGPLALARDFQPAVGYDRAGGLAWAGGYGGDGVALTNLAGRTLAQLITGTDGEESRLCWVGHRSPRWEPRPLRQAGMRTMSAVAHGVDAFEERTGRRLPVAGRLLTRLLA